MADLHLKLRRHLKKKKKKQRQAAVFQMTMSILLANVTAVASIFYHSH